MLHSGMNPRFPPPSSIPGSMYLCIPIYVYQLINYMMLRLPCSHVLLPLIIDS
jgi:hypothetical protein